MERVITAMRSRWIHPVIAAVFALLALVSWAADRPLMSLIYSLFAALWSVCEYFERRRRR